MNLKNAEVEICVEICREDAVVPSYSREGDAGMDVISAENVLLKPGQTAVVPTGLRLAIPEGYEIQVRPRSGISLNTPLRISNAPGTIDSGYRDELGIIMTNTSEYMPGEDTVRLTPDSRGNRNGIYMIRKGDRIAQIVVKPVPRAVFRQVESVKDIGSNRGGGFGSTGV